MSTALSPHPLPAPGSSSSDAATPSAPRAEPGAALAELERAGGLIRLDELAAQLALREATPTPLMAVRRWVVQRRLMGFPWRGTRVFPAFQFAPASMTPRDEVGAVLAEFAGAYDDWDVLDWFVRPNSFLGNALPAERLASGGAGVVQAARADRFIIASL